MTSFAILHTRSSNLNPLRPLLAFVGSLALAVAAASLAVAQDKATTKLNELSAADVAAGWVRLFDGESMFGWKANNDVNWKVTGGVVHADSGDPGLLVTTTEFADFELRCDFRLSKGGNSGIFLRSAFQPKDPTKDCYELNMCDSHPAFKTGALVGRQKPVKEVVGEERWRTYHVRVEGPKVEVKLDGELILTYSDDGPGALRRGFIGLQKNVGHAEYRNIFLRPLGTKSLFNGKDLTGWRIVPGGKSEFKVEAVPNDSSPLPKGGPGGSGSTAIHVRDGRGFLETESTWGDFFLQAEIKTNGKHLNSGIFFRAMPGTAENPSNGYEAQVHNAWKGDERSQPVDFGTGAIYRRVAARRVVSNDFEWFTMTVSAQGPHVSVWVNGTQVTDWTDTRKPSDNPRDGLRVKPGHFSLQGHDPTTDLLFRNLRAVEMPKSGE